MPSAGRHQVELDDAALPNGHQQPQRLGFSLARFLNPVTYIRGLGRLVEVLLDGIMRLIHYIIPTKLWDRLSSVFEFLPHMLAGLLAFALAFALATQFASSTNGDWAPSVIEATLRTIDKVKHGLQDFVPSVTWTKRDHWVDVEDLWQDDGAASDRLGQFLGRMEEEFLSLKRAGKMHEASVKRLESIVPSIVHMELKDGRPVVSQEFWHALRDLLRADGGFLTLDKVGSDCEVSSDKQWRAVASRLVRDATFTAKLNATLEEFETKLDGKRAAFWDTWVKDNDDKIARMLGSAVEQVKSAGSQREFEERVRGIVEEQLSQTQQVVSRDEFLRHLGNELASHRAEMRAELKDLQPQLEQLVRRSVELATGDSQASRGGGVSRAEAAALVKGLVREALADVDLEALARGTIHRHWDTELRHQINYFAVGSGAAIDAHHSSPTWDPARRGPGSGSGQVPRPVAALQPWQDQGDCWCAARSVNHRGNPHGASLAVRLGHRVIPQHVVVEHIPPGATSEPGARPRLVQVYASIDDSALRERVLDFAAAHLPDDDSDWNYTPPEYPSRFVKISQFTYEAAHRDDGVHVHRLSSELVGLGADTDHVIIRAVSNYGAENHTCFYRVRLYGLNTEADPWP